MKTLTTLLFACCCFLSVQAITPPDSTLVLYSNWSTGSWDTAFMRVITFDQASNRETILYKSFRGNASFRDSFRITVDYNDQAQVTRQEEEWLIGMFVSIRRSYVYNKDGIKTSNTIERKIKTTTTPWELRYRDSTRITYDAQERAVGYDLYGYNINTGMAWPTGTRYSVAAFGADGMPSEYYQTSGKDTVTHHTQVKFKDYKGKDLLAVMPTDYEVRGLFNEKQISNRKNGRIDKFYSYYWSNNQWVRKSMTTFNYDHRDSLIEKAEYFWNDSIRFNKPYYGKRDSILYDTNGLPSDIIISYVDFHGNWFEDEWQHHYYTTYPVGTENASFSSLELYPNPASSSVQIRLAEGNMLRILDVQGRLHQEILIDSTLKTIDLGSYPQGLLFFQFTAPNGSLRTERLLHR